MTSSSSPIRGALRVLSATAVLGAAGLTAAPAMAADTTFKDAVRQVVAQNNSNRGDRRSDRSDRNRRDESRNRNQRSDRSDRSRDRDRSRNRDRSRDRNRSWDRSRSYNRNYNSSRNRHYNGVRNSIFRTGYTTPHGWSSSRRSNPWSSHTGRNKYRNNYRSGLGISFSFGSPGYSRYRWAPTRHSFYRPSFGSYSYYAQRTTCRPIILDSQWHGRIRKVEVTQCSNPWDGTYIVQGSERFIGNHHYRY